MVTFRSDTCDIVQEREPGQLPHGARGGRKTVVLNRWRRLCPGCFDVEREKAGVRFDLDG